VKDTIDDIIQDLEHNHDNCGEIFILRAQIQRLSRYIKAKEETDKK
jgi:hypothetical protein